MNTHNHDNTSVHLPQANEPITPAGSHCATCSVYRAANLKKLGVGIDNWDFVVALAGNPNTGKSTVFNALTGLRQHTGNWPGKTVSRAEGGYVYDDNRYKLVDLPGTYSLLSTSLDEQIARDFILFGEPDVTVIVADATRLERNLNLVLQILEITERAVLCLNLMDEAERHGIKVDDRQLSRDLGIPVVPVIARFEQGFKELLEAIHDVATGAFPCKPLRVATEPAAIKPAVDDLTRQLETEFPNLANPRWVALRLLSGDESVIKALQSGELGNLHVQTPAEPQHA